MQPDSPVAESLVKTPRRYGFHATLKPPFWIKPDVDANQVCQLTQALASRLTCFRMPLLSVQWLNGFLALRPASNADPALAPLINLATESVRALEPMRRVASATELAARDRKGLSALEQSMLAQWGYPYVLDAWRFHMTLTGPISDRPDALALRTDTYQYAHDFFEASLREPLHCDAICLFVEPEPAAEFKIWQRFPLTG